MMNVLLLALVSVCLFIEGRRYQRGMAKNSYPTNSINVDVLANLLIATRTSLKQRFGSGHHATFVDVRRPGTPAMLLNTDLAQPREKVSIEELTVNISSSERVSQMNADSVRSASELLKRHGVCLLRDIMDAEAVQKLHDITIERFRTCEKALNSRGIEITEGFAFNEICHRSKFRHDMQLAGVQEPELDALHNADAAWYPLVESILNKDVKHVFTGAVIALPGASPQNLHGDGPHLSQTEHLPPHCINIFLPLVDVTEKNGPTEFLPGTQEQALAKNRISNNGLALAGRIGDAIVFDYRVLHRGLANHGDDARPVLYMTFSHNTFEDTHNFPEEQLILEGARGSSSAGFGKGGFASSSVGRSTSHSKKKKTKVAASHSKKRKNR